MGTFAFIIIIIQSGQNQNTQKKKKNIYEFACKEAKNPQVNKMGDWLRGCINYSCILASKMLPSKMKMKG